MSGLSRPHQKALTLNPKSMQSQRGNDCKMITLGTVLSWLHENKRIQQPPLPPRFRHEKNHSTKPQDERLHSLRQVAKQKLAEKQRRNQSQGAQESKLPKQEVSTQVTEAIDDVEILVQVATHHAEITADYLHCENQAQYLHLLKQAIDRNLAPIVFFDVDPKTGQPGLFRGTHEHSAVVIGYSLQRGKIYFKLAQWGHEVEVKGSALFASTGQLRSENPAEAYYRYPERKKESGEKDEGGKGWIPEVQIREAKFLQERFEIASSAGDLSTHPCRQCQITNASSNHGGLKGKILLIAPTKEQHLIKELKRLEQIPAVSPSADRPCAARTSAPFYSPSEGQAASQNQQFPWLKTFLGLSSLYLLTGSIAACITEQAFIGITLSAAPYVLIVGAVIGLLLLAWCWPSGGRGQKQEFEFSGSGSFLASEEVLGQQAGFQPLATNRLTATGFPPHPNPLYP